MSRPFAKNTITVGVGPAGTGKTYLAVAAAVAAFRAKEVNRIILTRPAVEAGERLGFLPGDLQNKVDPYLRPLYDALFDMLGSETYQKYLERGNIEVAPLAYMRGRTLDDSFIILDEAQNTTREQMKMFLTRLGFNSKIVITGDITQIDLPGGQDQRPEGRGAGAGAYPGYRHLPPGRQRRRPARPGAKDRRRLRQLRAAPPVGQAAAENISRKEEGVRMKHKIVIAFQARTLRRLSLSLYLKKCIRTALAQEHVPAACEISVLLTDDDGIRAINQAQRQIDRATDVLSFPMFQLHPRPAAGGLCRKSRPGHGACPPGGYGHLPGAGPGPGEGIRALGAAGAGLSDRPLRAASAGV